MKPPLDLVDIPPVWLALCLAIAWWLGHGWPMPLPFAPALGTILLGAGIALFLAALREFARARTTVVPRREPSALVTTGVFRLTRNPIYLGDALILAGLALLWQAPLALLLVPAFMAFIDRRFIRAEEARLRAAFGPAFDAWAGRTRRWL
ncbi:MAG: isoprenylcysteine carboxylmethyltransferase family protein [Rhodobacteraceae bacterium]|nr:isoprenylcysteine carboxylmethyltransferase family protein [Paracoccaceae bacterium]